MKAKRPAKNANRRARKAPALTPAQARRRLAQAERQRVQAVKAQAAAAAALAPGEAKQARAAIQKRGGKLALFLGAGASKAFGWPLTSELLPAILNGLMDEDLFEDSRINTPAIHAGDRVLLGRYVDALCPGLKMTRNYVREKPERLPLVTGVLSLLDYSLVTGQALVSGFTVEETRHARTLLERAIYEVIEYTDNQDDDGNWLAREPNATTARLAAWLESVRTLTSVGVITSNYDLAMEAQWYQRDDNAMEKMASELDFGFGWLRPTDGKEQWFPRPITPLRRLYKLHGSTNWLRCSLCDRVYINPEVDIAVFAYERKADPRNSCHCGHSKLDVQIVSPSFVREMRDPNLIAVWRGALEWLREAEDWLIVGYSFPDEDMNIRALFTRALASRKTSPHVTVVQHGVNEQTRVRYETFFPSEILSYLTGGLEAFL